MIQFDVYWKDGIGCVQGKTLREVVNTTEGLMRKENIRKVQIRARGPIGDDQVRQAEGYLHGVAEDVILTTLLAKPEHADLYAAAKYQKGEPS